MIQYKWAVTQEQQAASDGALMADAAAGRELMRQLFGAPVDFAEAVQEYEDKGAQFVAPGIDWAAVEDDCIGD